MNKPFLMPELAIYLALQCFVPSLFADNLGNYESHIKEGNTLIFTTESRQKVRIRPYTDYMIRITAAKTGKNFHPDNYYEMVEKHDLGGTLTLSDKDDALEISTGVSDGIKVIIKKKPMRFEFYNMQSAAPVLKDKNGINWTNGKFGADFVYDANEHMCGLGHEGWIGQKSWVDKKIEAQEFSIDLNGKQIKNYSLMGMLHMPFYLSQKGYGLFYNIMFPWNFSFNSTLYGVNFDDLGSDAEMDYFFILGPEFGKIIDRYTQLTGKPRFPPLAQFGLALSQHEGPGKRDENWWKTEINELRKMGNGFDHAVMDNYWRSPDGTWGNSEFSWRTDWYPDPAKFATWLKENGVVLTLDLNRAISKNSWGWKGEYGIPGENSWPDFTKRATKDWIWEMFWKKSFNPELKYPGDAIWLDEMETMDGSNSLKLSNGRTVGELRNYTPFLAGKAVTGEGWDNEEGGTIPGIGEVKRPWIWSRSGCAGAQRYINYWTGDIPFHWKSMQGHAMALLRSGLGAFPYFNHDAGGFNKVPDDSKLTDEMYKQWLCAWGSFTPIWRPHGYDASRWPQRRNADCQAVFKKYNNLRYEMMPYIYTYAYQSYSTGMPMARAMVIDYQNEPNAWKYDYQYMWGSEMLVSPNTTGSKQDISIWLPGKWNWYDFWTDQLHNGNQVINYLAEVGVLPIFVHEGSIIPRYAFAKSTAWIKHDTLILHVYPGKDGTFLLYEDDGVTEKFRTKGEKRTTAISWKDDIKTLNIDAAKGTFTGAPTERVYIVYFHASTESIGSVNDAAFIKYDTEDHVKTAGSGLAVKSNEKIVVAYTGKLSVDKPVSVHIGQPVGVNTASGLSNKVSWALQRISPNVISIKTATPGKHSIKVTNLAGKTVASFTGTDMQTYIWKSSVGGVYFIRSERSGGNNRVDRVVVWR